MGGSRRLLPVGAVTLGLAAAGLAAQTAQSADMSSRSENPPIGVHSMLYLSTPYSAKKAMFQQAAEMGASEIRLNIELSSVFPGPARPRGRQSPLTGLQRPTPLRVAARGRKSTNPLAHPHWTGVDEYLRLARSYHLHVLAVLTSTPAWMASCPRGTPSNAIYRCPPADPGEWARAVAKIAGHTAGVVDAFEVMNEPDGRWSFLGSPQQYAKLLAASYNAIHTIDPTARVLLGGIMHLGSSGWRWMNAMLATPGTDAVHKFDVANLHLRVAPLQVPVVACQWQGYFARKGFHGPLWVTETGYPADRGEQTDAGYTTGPRAQARWLTAAIPAMLASGVAKVFVTERDLSHGEYASEGVLQEPNPLPARPRIRRRPSFYAVQRLAGGAWFSAELRFSQQSSGSRNGGSGRGIC